MALDYHYNPEGSGEMVQFHSLYEGRFTNLTQFIYYFKQIIDNTVC